jgi:hypothetical protein
MTRLLLVMVLTLLAAAPAAMAGTRSDIIRDCNDDGKLDGNYTPSQIRDARNNIPADIDQYSDCRDVLARALGGTGKKTVGGRSGAGGAGGGSGAGGSGGSGEKLKPSGAGEQRALETAGRGGNGPVQLGQRSIVPGAAGFATGAARNGMPTSLLAVLILLGLAALAGAVPYVRKRVFARRQP